MKRILLSIITLLVLSGSAYAGKAVNPFPLPVDAFSASFEYGPFSWMLNPVFTDSDMRPHIAYRYTRVEGNSTNHFMVNIFGFAFGYSGYGSLYSPTDEMFHEADTGLLSISRGFIFGNVFGLGIGYSAGLSGKNGYDDYHGWNAGLLFRPFQFFSLGISFRDFGGELEGKNLEVTQTYSVSIRPFSDWLTLSADRITGSAADNGGTYYSFSGEVKLRYNATICLSGDTRGNFTAGITVPFDTRISTPLSVSADFYGSHNRDDPEFKSGGAAIRFRPSGGVNVHVTHNTLLVQMSESYAENDPSGFFAKSRPEFLELISGIMAAADDPSIDSMVIEIGDLEMGFAQLQEIRRALNFFRARGKKIYAIMNDTGNRQYYIASSADKIYLTPNSEFVITGLSARVYFIKGLLDNVGIQYESVKRGDYKSFNEPFTRNEMSPEAKANLESILADLNEQFISAITERSLISRDKVKKIFAAGFYTPEEAKSEGFIDEVMYREDAIDSLSENSVFVKFESYCSEKGTGGLWGITPAIAVIYVKGSIISGRGDPDGIAGTTGNTDYAECLEHAFRDPAVKGVVIRIDSGGGSASASDFMWKSLVHLKKKYPKPVVISFGNVAASGGYYIACTGDRIFAEKGTITGSIGVISGKISAKELYAKLGINKQTISLSEFADIYDESRPMTENEYKVLDRSVGFIYDRFTQKVIEARKIPAADIEKLAGGRVHTGNGAKGKGLVDEEGGIYTAIAYCRMQCGIEGEFRILQLPDNSGFLPSLRGSLWGTNRGVLDMFMRSARLYEMLDDQALYLQPYYIEIE